MSEVLTPIASVHEGLSALNIDALSDLELALQRRLNETSAELLMVQTVIAQRLDQGDLS